jgi:signal transduction histidine kinase
MVLVCIEDVTALKSAELRLQGAYTDLERQNEELKKLDVIKSSLIRDVSHELKTPVAKFSMQLEILRSALEGNRETDRVKESLLVMEGNVKRQESVIGNILDLSRLEGGARKFSMAGMRLDRLLVKIVAEFSHLLESYGMEVKTYLDEMTIISDEEMLWHVFSNLLGNAVKFTRDNPRGMIEIRSSREDGWVTVRVEDNGLGISEEGTAKVFGAFFQDTASSEGIGVGLSITKTIVEGLGGRVRLESQGRGKGATATVELPERAPG